ncbi:hypothetical protein EPN42_04500 [bacterium]|nr:MAG: hypothetical protein EPN42_04500 [bacterium]
MARSYRHTPIVPNTSARSDGDFKRLSARAMRHRNAQLIRLGADVLFDHPRQVVNSHKAPKDGKWYAGTDSCSARLLRK